MNIPNAATVSPIIGRPVWFPRGYVSITLNAEHRREYRRLYGMYFPLPDVPALKDRDFEGRSIKVRKSQLAALNRRLLTLIDDANTDPPSAFRDQEESLTKNAHEILFLS
jgi:hypothetical protein